MILIFAKIDLKIKVTIFIIKIRITNDVIYLTVF